MISQEFIDLLIIKPKFIQQNIIWSKKREDERYQTFKVDVFSNDGEYFILTGDHNTKRKKIASLAIVYNREVPLVRIDKKHHQNPIEVNALEFRGWHKHKYDIVWEDKIAFDVSNEFDDTMLPGVMIKQFKRENNIRFIEGKAYQRLLYE